MELAERWGRSGGLAARAARISASLVLSDPQSTSSASSQIRWWCSIKAWSNSPDRESTTASSHFVKEFPVALHEPHAIKVSSKIHVFSCWADVIPE